MVRKFRVNSFFAGIGGFDLGLENAGFKTTLQCEVNNFCRATLKYHWPSVPVLEDITKINFNEIPEADLWCGGFPCQDVSVARGSKGRDGLNGKNSGLFYPFFELIKEHKPKVVLLENVVGLLSSHNGQDFRVILEKLTGEGYTIAWRVMNSRYFGSPQSRPRIFICAALDDPNLPLKVLYENTKGSKPGNKRKGFLKVNECKTTGAKVAEIAYCLAATSGRHTGTDWSRTYVSYDNAVRRLTPTECEGLQGFPVGWTDRIRLGSSGKENDVDSLRYHALGNAVSVPVVEWIGKRLKKAMHSCTVSAHLPEDWILNSPDFLDSSCRSMSLSELHYSTKPNGHTLKWQSGGFAYKDECWDIKTPEGPSSIKTSKLIDVIEKIEPEEKYFLSKNAAIGILRRVSSQNRTLFGPMQEALLNMASAP